MPEAQSPPPNPSTDPNPATPPADQTAPSETPQQPAVVMPDASADDLRAEVRRLRDEASETRVKSRRADTLAARLVESYAAATGLLVDPSDLRADPATLLDDDGLPDPVKVRAAVDDLIAARPHLASRTPRGDINQGARDDAGTAVDLAGMLRAGA